MKKTLISILAGLTAMMVISCSSNQRDQARTITAQGLSQGISNLMLDQEIVKCSNDEVFKQFVLNKTCEVLKADCGSYISLHQVSRTKGIVARFACNTALKIAMPAIMPSKHLPQRLREAGCEISKVDDLAENKLKQLCAKL